MVRMSLSKNEFQLLITQSFECLIFFLYSLIAVKGVGRGDLISSSTSDGERIVFSQCSKGHRIKVINPES